MCGEGFHPMHPIYFMPSGMPAPQTENEAIMKEAVKTQQQLTDLTRTDKLYRFVTHDQMPC